MIIALLMMLMTAVTAGLGRTIKRDAAGARVTGTESEAVDLSEWDNNAAPRPVFFSRMGGRGQATPDDVPIPYNVAIRGTEGEILAFQVDPEAELTTDQADSVLTRLKVLEIIYGADGKVKKSHERTLTANDRITRPGDSTGENHRLGISDGGTLPKDVFGDYMRFAPPENAEWVLKGRQRMDVHNST